MPNLKHQIIELLGRTPGLTDREITNALKGAREPQQPVNIASRELAAKGVLQRRRRDDGLIGNYPGAVGDLGAQSDMGPPSIVSNTHGATNELSEDEVKRLLCEWLEREGWTVKVIWGKERGLDIEAIRGAERWCIEAKGCGSLQPMRVNYFLAILGETLQRMNDPAAHYSIALPDLKQFRGPWERLPRLAKERTTISALFVSADGSVTCLTSARAGEPA